MNDTEQSVDEIFGKITSKIRIEKYFGDLTQEEIDSGEHTPYDVIEEEGNLGMYGGISCLWECLIGNGTATGAQNLTFFNNANAHIGVGDSSTAAAATQTDLQAATNKLRKPMDTGFPTHTDGTTSPSATITFKSIFGSGDANFAWNEWGVFNDDVGHRMLNRKVSSLGTKSAGTTWNFTVTITIA